MMMILLLFLPCVLRSSFRIQFNYELGPNLGDTFELGSQVGFVVLGFRALGSGFGFRVPSPLHRRLGPRGLVRVLVRV